MKRKKYELLYAQKYSIQQHEADGYGLCYNDRTGFKTYIHIRIYGYGDVLSFEYFVTLDRDKVADSDINELVKELRRKFQSTP